MEPAQGRSAGLVSLACLVIIYSAIVAGLNASLSGIESLNFYTLVLAALLLSWWLARSHRPGWQAAIVLVCLGLALIALSAGGLGTLFFALLRAFSQYFWAGIHWRVAGPLPDATLVVQLASELGRAAQALLDREATWLAHLLQSKPDHDLSAATIAWSVLLWSAAGWAGWAVRRLGKPLLAVLPGVAVFAASMAYARANAFYLFPALSVSLVLVAWHHYSERQAHWERNAIGFAEDLRFDTSLWALAFIIFVTLPAMLISGFSPQKALETTRHLLEKENPNAAQVGSALGLERSSAGKRAGGNPGILPRQHLLGSGPELSKQTVMLIHVTGEQPSIHDPLTSRAPLPTRPSPLLLARPEL